MTIYVPGPLIETNAYRHAIWTLSILEYVYDDLQLILHGSDDAEGSIAKWSQGIITSDTAVSLVTSSSPVEKLLIQANIIWLPTQRDALPDHIEYLAAQQKPILASDFPSLRQRLKLHTQTQFLPANEPSLWAKAMFKLLALQSGLRSAA
jgi:hypothetical protein